MTSRKDKPLYSLGDIDRSIRHFLGSDTVDNMIRNGDYDRPRSLESACVKAFIAKDDSKHAEILRQAVSDVKTYGYFQLNNW